MGLLIEKTTQTDELFDAQSTPKAVAGYLLAVRPMVGTAAETRRTFIRDLGRLLQQIKLGDNQLLAKATGQLGAEGRAAFRDVGLAMEGLRPPPACSDCHDAVQGWVQMHVAACEVMIEVGQSADLKGLREAQGLLAEGRHFARRFNAEYGALAAALRQRASRRKFRR
jgi:hypothetical protein